MQDKSDKTVPKSKNSRRDFIQKAGLLIGGGMAGASIGQAIAMGNNTGKVNCEDVDYSTLKYNDNEWNRDAFARIMGDLDFGKQKFGWYRGTVKGVMPGQPIKDLFGFEGFSYARLKDNGDGTYQKLLREVGYYTDLKTGEVMDEYHNPYNDEKVKVVHIANDPFNHVISAFFPQPPSYGGINKDKKPPKIPFIMPWTEVGNNKVMLQNSINLFYPNALQPEKWPRESSGKMNQVSEMFNYVFDKEDLANPNITGLEFSGSWSRITPWLPWMLMGQSAGHITYDCIQGCYNNTDMMSPKIRAYAKKHHPEFFNAPTEWAEPSWSSLEHYAHEQTPAPVKK
ncbi:DUF1838 family protein [Paraglaciecola sp. 2405UD69-4]|uniref:DUF1838 family protein n=1 Tax=Paraglaciecola sp. 2405UD69-4 TaxID=3391836 RepID=UPI0039C9FB27